MRTRRQGRRRFGARRALFAVVSLGAVVLAGCSSGDDPMDAFLAAAADTEEEPEAPATAEEEVPVTAAEEPVGDRVGVYEMPVAAEVTLDPDKPLGAWGMLRVDRAVGVQSWGDRTASRAQQLLVVDLHYVGLSGEPGSEATLVPASFRVVADGKTYTMVEPPELELPAGAVFNQPVVFEIPATTTSLRIEAGVDESSLDGFGVSVPVDLVAGSIPDSEPRQAEGPVGVTLDSSSALATPTSCDETCDTFLIKVDDVFVSDVIGPDVANPGFAFLTVSLRATNTNSEVNNFFNRPSIQPSDVRIESGGEWYGPLSTEIATSAETGVTTLELIFETPSGLASTIEVGPPKPHLEPGQESTYFAVREIVDDDGTAVLTNDEPDDVEPVPGLDIHELDIEPCDLLTDTQLVSFADTGPVRSSEEADVFFGIAGCVWEVGALRTVTVAAFSATAYPQIVAELAAREALADNEVLGPIIADSDETDGGIDTIVEELDGGKGLDGEASCELFQAIREGDFDTDTGYRAHRQNELAYWGHSCQDDLMVVVGLADRANPDERPEQAAILRAAIDDVYAALEDSQ